MLTEKTILPPNDNDAEENTIGSLLINGDAIDEVSLSPDDFYYDTHQFIFKAMINLRKRNIGINQITVAEELRVMDKLDKINGGAKLSYLISVVGSSLDLRWYADIVKRMSVYRQLINVSNNISEMAHKASGELSDVLNKSDEMLLNIRKKSDNTIILTPQDIADIAFEHYTDLNNQDGIIPVPSCLIDLDREIGGGFYKGEMTILAGRPGMGKTEICLTIANSASVKGNVLFCSAEMAVEGLIDRIVAGELGITVSQLRQGKYPEGLFETITGAPIQKLKSSNLYFYRDMPMTTSKILQAGMTMKLRYGIEMIIIDYLGILDDEYGNNGYERVGYISRKTKQMARTLDIPVIAIHQLHREVEKREDKRPQLSDLRDSGKLEEDADLVLLLYRDSYYLEDSDNKTEIIIAKNRQGIANRIVEVLYDSKKRIYKNLVKENSYYGDK